MHQLTSDQKSYSNCKFKLMRTKNKFEHQINTLTIFHKSALTSVSRCFFKLVSMFLEGNSTAVSRISQKLCATTVCSVLSCEVFVQMFTCIAISIVMCQNIAHIPVRVYIVLSIENALIRQRFCQ